MNFPHLKGLVAAAHTPFNSDSSLRLDSVEKQAAHFIKTGVSATFIAGTTGECHSLTVDERMRLAERWMDATRGTALQVIVHVGSNCIADSRALAEHAQKVGACAIAALSPSYFKPRTVGALLECCVQIASGAPALRFYFYDIPSLTGVSLPMPEFLAQGRARIPTLAGIKWTNSDLFAYQLCRHVPGDFDLPWGNDEYLLAGLALGATGAVGSTYCFAAPLYLRIMHTFAAGNLATARAEQYRSAQLVQVLAGYGYMSAAKAVMGMLNVDVGPARLPHTNLSNEHLSKLRNDLDALGFFDWVV